RRGVVVLFGGNSSNGSYLGDTWEYNGALWAQSPVGGPSPTRYHSMVYDSGRNRIVMFGGQPLTGIGDQTWEYDGAIWKRKALTGGPSSRYWSAMAYDSARSRTVLYGGGAPTLGDTWEWDGTTWAMSLSGN